MICGSGEGTDKKSAKRLAASKALIALKWSPGIINMFTVADLLLTYSRTEDHTFTVPLEIDRTSVTDLESYLEERGLRVFWGYERTSEHDMAAWIAYCFGEFMNFMSHVSIWTF